MKSPSSRPDKIETMQTSKQDLDKACGMLCSLFGCQQTEPPRASLQEKHKGSAWCPWVNGRTPRPPQLEELSGNSPAQRSGIKNRSVSQLFCPKTKNESQNDAFSSSHGFRRPLPSTVPVHPLRHSSEWPHRHRLWWQSKRPGLAEGARAPP